MTLPDRMLSCVIAFLLHGVAELWCLVQLLALHSGRRFSAQQNRKRPAREG